MKKIQIRQKKVKLRKNFFITFLITIFLWTSTAGLIYFVEPTSFGALPLFFFIVFLTLTFTLSIIFTNTRRGVLLSLIIVFYLLLRYLSVGNVLNLLLLTGIGIVTELYILKKY